MKIDPNELIINKSVKTEKTDKKELHNQILKAKSDEDSVSFSENLKKAEEKVIDILNYPDKRAEKIENLKGMIKSGEYNVDVHKLTDKIIEDLVYGGFYQ